MWVQSFFGSSCSKVCIDGSSPFSVLVCFHNIWKASLINSGHLAWFLSYFKICLNSRSSRAGKAKFQVPLALLWILMGSAQCHFDFIFGMAWTESSKSCFVVFLLFVLVGVFLCFVWFFMRGEEYIYKGGRKAHSDMKSSSFLRITN